MRRVAVIAIVSGSLGMGGQYAVDGRWGMVLACLLAGALWLFPSQYGAGQRPTISLLFLAGAGGAGVYLEYAPVWLLTHFVILLIAWDLDHFTRVLQQFSRDHAREKEPSALFHAHLRRLGMVAGLGWCLGMAALYVRVPTRFAGALALGLLVFLSLQGIVRFFDQGGGSNAE